MEYGSARCKKNYRKVKDQIIKLWLECQTWEEFKVKVSLDVPEARWRDILACKLHWLRRSYPVAYRFSWLVVIPALIWSFSFTFFCLINGISEYSVAYSIITVELVYGFIILFHLGFFGDFMRELQWNEEGCLIDY